jgi:hypothetical protein
MDEVEESFQDAVAALEEVAHTVKPPDAWRRFGDLTVERFWQSWPDVRAWAEWMWRLADAERGEKAAPVEDPDLDESGTAG